ncbi:MAG: hypothetical protein LBP93_02070 [Treponema sp.]|jgi:hypothetical protein|nr:hypothetical protein [Treponema sp.]
MAIQPIDLQTLFTQLDKVAKTQVNQKEGFQIQQALQGDQIRRKTEERIQSVNESQDTGQGAEGIKDRSSRKGQDQGPAGKESGSGEPGAADEGEPPVIRDPALGKNVDVSG